MEFENQEEDPKKEEVLEAYEEVHEPSTSSTSSTSKQVRRKVKCEVCGKEVDPRGLKRHMGLHNKVGESRAMEKKEDPSTSSTSSTSKIEIIDSEAKIPKSGIDKVIDFLSKPEILPFVIAGAGALAMKLQQGPGIKPGTNPNDPAAPAGYHYETVQSGAKVLCKDGF